MAFRLFKHTWLGTDYPNHNNNDIIDCLEKLINPMLINNCGWSWDTKHCPESKPILLQPTATSYAAFIKHTSGAKAMIGYSLNGLQFGLTTNGTNNDIGFLPGHSWKIETSNNNKFNGLFFSFITADSVNNDGADFHPEYNITDENFYDAQMSLIFSLTQTYYSSTLSAASCSMIKTVTNSNQCTHYLMADTEFPILYLGSKCTTNKTNQAIFGEIADGQRRYSYDTRNTAKFAAFMGAGSYNSNRGEDYITPSNDSSSYIIGVNGLNGFNVNGTGFFSTYPRLTSYNWFETTPRTASLICDSYRIYNQNLRAINITGVSYGQAYDNGNWCCIGYTDTSNSQSGQFKISCGPGVSNSWTNCLIVKWDSEFNQGNRLE